MRSDGHRDLGSERYDFNGRQVAMGRFLKALRAGVRGAAERIGPGSYATGGGIVACSHCRRTEFAARPAQMNTAGMSFLKLDWMNPTATALVCTNCGLIQWFAVEPERVEE